MSGVWAAATAYFLWGFFPIYWKWFASMHPAELTAHRVIWSLPFLLLLLPWRGTWDAYRRALTDRRQLLLHLLSGVLLSANWLLYIAAVLSGHILEASLGYFLLPLLNVALGFLILGERLRPGQWISVAIAAAGVAWRVWDVGHLPWIALAIAATFGGYGLLKKRSSLGPLSGLALETTVLFPVAAIFLGSLFAGGTDTLRDQSWGLAAALPSTGVVTAVPLLLFAFGAQRVSLATLGVLQYLAPSIKFILALALYHEPVTPGEWIAFACVWVALAVYTAEGWWFGRSRRAPPTGSSPA